MNKKPLFILVRNQKFCLFLTIFLLLSFRDIQAKISFLPLIASAPTITSFSPTSGVIGTSVTITGTSFNATANQNVVFFGATQATVTAASSTSLTVTVPIGATYQSITVLNLATTLMANSAAPFRVTFTGGAIVANSLDPKVDFSTGIKPASVSIGDLDGDGKADLVVVNQSSNTISVFRNAASSGSSITSSSFAGKVDFTTGTQPVFVSIGDLDGDGKPDLVVANYSSSTISVLRNTATSGNITSSSFAGKVDFKTGTAPYSVSIGDLDRDGKPDLVVANGISTTISVFRNTASSGSITSSSFAGKVDFTTGSGPTFVSIGDLDGDGKADLVVANESSNTISVFRNTASSGSINSGSFAGKVDFTTGIQPGSVSIGDLDGDGKPDLVVTNQSSNTISVFRNTATSGSITSGSFAGKADFTTGTNPYSVGIGDLDGDGKPDLVLNNYGSNTISVFRNTASSGSITSSSFAGKVDFTTGFGPVFVSIGDLDGDGKPDLVVANSNANSISVFRNNPPPPPPPPTITSFSPTSGVIGTSVTITGTSFNATANQNVVFFGATQATVTAAGVTSLTVTVPVGATYQPITVLNLATTLMANSAAPFQVTFTGGAIAANSLDPKVDFSTGSEPAFVSMGDLDGDGKADLVVVNQSSNTISVFRNTASSGSSITSSSFAGKVDFTTGTQPISVSIGDLDGDGKPDLVVANIVSGTISVFRNTASSGSITSSSFAGKVDFTTGIQPNSVSIGDLDGDGKPDLVVTNYGSNTISVFRNTASSGSITSSSFAGKVDFTTGTKPNSVSIGDFDGDGKPDLVVPNSGSNTVSVFLNTASSGIINSGSFAGKVDFTTGFTPLSVSIGDLDGDGKPDLVVTNYDSGTISVFRNTTSSGSITIGSFATKVDFTTGSNPLSVSIGDLDGDGKPDLVVTNLSSNAISVFRNTALSGSIISSSFAGKVDFMTGSNPLSVSIGDLDGDGKPDLVVANINSNSISVFRNNPPLPPPPTITSFSPTSGVIGTSVIITGTNFNATANQNMVFFGATQATVTAAGDTSLTVTVPVGATYQPITVLNLATTLMANSAAPFRVTFTGGAIAANSLDPKVDFSTGSTPRSVSMGDLDGDGKADLVVANYISSTISVFRNTASSGSSITSSSFAGKVDFTTGLLTKYPVSVSIGDLDGDGKPDLVVVGGSSNTMSVFRNTATSGSITRSSFADQVSFDMGKDKDPISVSIGDLDGDGKPDLVVTNGSSKTISVFRNTASSGSITIGSFAAKVNFTTGSRPCAVSIGDLDGDGKPDLVVVNNFSNTISVFRTTATSGSITGSSFAGKVDFTTGSAPGSVSMGDLDGDGKPDLVVANTGSNTVSVFRNTATSGSITSDSFAGKVDFITGIYPKSVSIGDLDGDGKPDLVVANLSSDAISVFPNTATSGSITSGSFAGKVDFTTGKNPFFVSIGDLDGNGKPDLVVANSNDHTISVFRNNPKTPLSPQGSLSANGPFCTYGTGQLTFTATEGIGPFTVIYHDGTAERTATNVASGTAFDVFTNPVTKTTTYTLVSVTDTNSIVRTSEFTNGSDTITIYPISQPTATASSNSPLCAGNTINLLGDGLSAASIASSGSYAWTGPNSFSSALQNPSVNSATTAANGTYQLMITNAEGCTAIATTSVIINALPTASASGNSPLCAGNTISLVGGGLSAPSIVPSGSYAWTGPSSFSSALQNPSVASATTAANGTYQLIITNTNGCTAIATTSVTVNALPTASASSNSPLCAGTTINLSASGGSSYAWTGPNSFSSTLQNPSVASATSSANGTYQVIVTNVAGCTAMATTSVTVNPVVVIPTPQANTQIIFGGSVTLTATGCSGNNVLKWYQSADNTLVTMPVSPLATTNYYAKCQTTLNGITCSSGNSINVTLTVLIPTPPVSTEASNCLGTATTLIATGCSGEVGTFVLKWYQNADDVLVTMPVSPLVSTDYYAKCEQTSNAVTVVSNKSNVVTLTILNPPTPVSMGGTIYKSQSTTLNATGCSGILRWYKSLDNALVIMPVSPTVTTQYYAKCEQTANTITCRSAKSNDVGVTVVNRIFVDIAKIAAPTQDGNSWATAYGSLQAGLEIATKGIEVWVAKGTYKPTTTTTRTIYFNIPNNIAVYGGFAGTEDNLNERDLRTNVSILSGDVGTQNAAIDNTYHVVVMDGSSRNTVLDGFTITGGNANFDPKIIGYPTNNGMGSSATSESYNTGGGILVLNTGRPTITHCKIMANNAILGGGIFCDGSTPTINECVISNNESTFGSAIYAQNASHFSMNNVLIVANRGLGCVYSDHSNPLLTNCTIASNGGYNGAIFNSQSQPIIKNSILWGNAEPFNDTQSIISYSIVQVGYPGIGNLVINPKFITPAPFELAPNATGDYHLQATSLAIDRGDNGSISLTDKDLDGNLRRFAGGRVDMGTYEFQGTGTSTLVISVVTGPWEANSTWDIGRVPQLGDYVVIDNNHVVTMSTSGIAKNLQYRGTGTLKFNSATSKLELGF